jgi:hypothetical protein
VTEVIGAAGALCAALGASSILCSDARGGLAGGLALAGAGIAVAVAEAALPEAAAVLVLGTAVAAAARFRKCPAGWGILPPGSTPRIVLCVVAGAAATYLGVFVLTAPGGRAVRVALLAVLALAGLRLLTERRPAPVFTAAAAIAIAGGATAALGAGPQVGAAALAAAGAVGLSVLPPS